MNSILVYRLQGFVVFVLALISIELEAGHIENGNKAILMVSDPYCPYACSETDEKQGYMVDIARLALEPLGYKVEYKVMPWKRVLNAAEQGTVDAVLSTELRDIDKMIKGKVAVSTTCQAIVTLNDSKLDWTKPYSFRGKIIGIINGYTYQSSINTWLNDKDKQNVISRVSGNNALNVLLNMVNRGRVDAMIADCNVGKLTAVKLGFEKNIKFHITGFSSDLYINVQKKRTDSMIILNAIDATVLQMKKDGLLKKLAEKYGISNS
jgi:polar amino acid transport system substrate-binding protein